MRAASLPPLVDLALVGVDGSELIVKVAMDRQPFSPFPSANGCDVSVQVGCDLFPGVQAAVGG
jgi:hypothetical protein